uniref:Uncharacterized protein n=1 Tax=Strigamia maritima TaxID=126957 RepID=T1JE84_STRMM
MLCPVTYSTTYNFDAQFEIYCQQNEVCKSLSITERLNFPFNDMNITLLDLWQPKTNMVIEPTAHCTSAVNFTQCNATDWLHDVTSIVNTTAGPCHIIKTNLEWHFIKNVWTFYITLLNISHLPVYVFAVDLYTTPSPSIVFSNHEYIQRNAFNNFQTTIIRVNTV